MPRDPTYRKVPDEPTFWRLRIAGTLLLSCFLRGLDESRRIAGTAIHRGRIRCTAGRLGAALFIRLAVNCTIAVL